MTWGVYQDYVTNRTQGTYHGGAKKYMGIQNKLYNQLYRSFGLANKDTDEFLYNKHYPIRGSKEYLKLGPSGGIFNLEFNPDGSILGAACEQKSIILFDPQTRRPVHFIEKAHDDCVNCIRFFDTRLFATCSDDTTIALWDARYLKKRLRTLRGHSNWVKNIEFSHKDNCLVTSGFDGAIYTWDINNYSERTDGCPEFRKVFYTNGLMRMRLTPTWDKMVVSTMNGYIMVVHDLCLDTMSQDLQNFKPNMYRLMQLSGQAMSVAVQYTPLFHAKRNRVEFICDFPNDDEAEIISSLQLHPQGWVAVSRNVSSDDSSEWCCVHDIHSYPCDEELDEDIDPELKVFKGVKPRRRRRESSESSEQHSESTLAQRSAGLGMARLAEFIGGVHFEGRRDSANDEHTSRSDERQQRETYSEGLGFRLINTENARQNNGDEVNIERNSNPSPEFRIRTLVNGVEVEHRRSSSETEESLIDPVDNRSRQDNNAEGALGSSSNASNLVGIIQLLGSVANSGSGTLRIRRRDTRSNESSQNIRPTNQNEDPRVPPLQQSSTARSDSDIELVNPNPIRIGSLAERNSSIHDSREGEPPTRRRRSHLGQQGFIIFPPDPLNAGGSPSILYFGGSGEGERSAVGDGTTGVRRDASDNVLPGSLNTSRARSSNSTNGSHFSNRTNLPKDARLHHNSQKLTHYIQESNQGRGFIKEVSFSSDGRIIASPFGYGIRLLAFNSDCSDLSSQPPTKCGPASARQLNEILHIEGCHEEVVLSSAFSPHDLTLVTGCLSGKVVWNQPVL